MVAMYLNIGVTTVRGQINPPILLGAHLSYTSDHRERTPKSDITHPSFTITEAHQDIGYVWKPSHWARSVGGRPRETICEGPIDVGDF